MTALHGLVVIPNPAAPFANGVRPACRRQGPAVDFRRGGACPARACPPWRATLRVASTRCRIYKGREGAAFLFCKGTILVVPKVWAIRAASAAEVCLSI